MDGSGKTDVNLLQTEKKKKKHLLFLLYIYFLTSMNTAEAVYAETELKKNLMEAQTH